MWNWLKMQQQNLAAWLAAHPKVVTFINGAERAALLAALAYIGQNVSADTATPSTFKLAGLGYAVVLALKLYAGNAAHDFFLSSAAQKPAELLAAKRNAEGVDQRGRSGRGY